MLLHKKHTINKEKTYDKLHNPKVLDVNLIQDELRISFDWKKGLAFLLMLLFIVAILTTEVYIGLNTWGKQEKVHLNKLQEEVAQNNKSVNDYKKEVKDAINYRNKTIEVEALLKNHIYWTNFIHWLEEHTLSSVSFDSIDGDLSGEYSLSATANNYADASWEAKVLAEDPITKKVEIQKVSANNDETKANKVEFIIDLVIDPSIFKH